MMKTFSFFAFMFVISSLALSFATGGGGMVSTQLNGGETIGSMSWDCDATTAFLSSGYLVCEGEIVHYSAKVGAAFTIDVRGAKGTKAAAHPDNAIVYSEDNGIINNILNFNVGSLFNEWGIFAVPMAIKEFFTTTIPYLAQGNAHLLFTGDLAIIAVIWACFPLGFIAMLIMWVLNLIRGN